MTVARAAVVPRDGWASLPAALSAADPSVPRGNRGQPSMPLREVPQVRRSSTRGGRAVAPLHSDEAVSEGEGLVAKQQGDVGKAPQLGTNTNEPPRRSLRPIPDPCRDTEARVARRAVSLVSVAGQGDNGILSSSHCVLGVLRHQARRKDDREEEEEHHRILVVQAAVAMATRTWARHTGPPTLALAALRVRALARPLREVPGGGLQRTAPSCASCPCSSRAPRQVDIGRCVQPRRTHRAPHFRAGKVVVGGRRAGSLASCGGGAAA